jgi:hypothetical protein
MRAKFMRERRAVPLRTTALLFEAFEFAAARLFELCGILDFAAPPRDDL